MYDLTAMGKRLKEERRRMGLSQRQASEMSGIQRSTINNLENGEITGRISTIAILAEFFGVTIDYLCGRDEA